MKILSFNRFMLKDVNVEMMTVQTVNACIASHSWGDWILWANSLTDICGLKNMKERNNQAQSQQQQQSRVWVTTGFITSSMCWPQWRHTWATLQGAWFNVTAEIGFIGWMWPYPSSSLLIWSQNPIIYSQSSRLLDGLLALSEKEKHVREYESVVIRRFQLVWHYESPPTRDVSDPVCLSPVWVWIKLSPGCVYISRL